MCDTGLCVRRQVNSSSYQAFDSRGYPRLATLGVEVDWNRRFLLQVSRRNLKTLISELCMLIFRFEVEWNGRFLREVSPAAVSDNRRFR